MLFHKLLSAATSSLQRRILRLALRTFASSSGSFPDALIQRNTSQPTHVPIPDQNIVSYVMQHFDEYGDSVALIDGLTTQQVTYGQLKKQVFNVASALVKSGMKPGDCLGICSPNSISYPPMMLAAMSVGIRVTTMNPMMTPAELAYQVQDSGASVIATIKGKMDDVKSAAPKQKLICLDGNHEGSRPFQELLADDGSEFSGNWDVSNEDIVLPYSSGTTGVPKGVILTHRNLVCNIIQLQHESALNLVRTDGVVHVLPFFHIFGLTVNMLTGLYAGAKHIILPRFEPLSFLNATVEHKATLMIVVPPMIIAMSAVENFPRDSVNIRTVLSGAAPLSAETFKKFQSRFPNVQQLRQGYGLTETSPLVCCCPPWENNPSTVGLPAINGEVAIRDTGTGELLPAHTTGELIYRGPNVMKGYYNDPEKTASCLKNGWFHTGDIGYYDENSFFYVTDRLKELIKYKGFQVAPAELEGLLLQHPGIRDAAVVGVSDPEAGEFPRAFVVSGDASLTAEDVQGFVKEKVSKHKWLRGGVFFVEQIPKSPSGKILRRLLV